MRTQASGWARENSPAALARVGYWTREEVVKMDHRALARMMFVHPERIDARMREVIKSFPRAAKELPVETPAAPPPEPAPEPIVKVAPPVVAFRPSGRRIKMEVAARYGLTVNDLECHSRLRKLALVRHEAMYLIARDTLLSFPQIAQLFGGRDHTTALHGVRRHADRNGLPRVREGVVA